MSKEKTKGDGRPTPWLSIYDDHMKQDLLLADYKGDPAWIYIKDDTKQWIPLRKANTTDIIKIVSAHQRHVNAQSHKHIKPLQLVGVDRKPRRRPSVAFCFFF